MTYLHGVTSDGCTWMLQGTALDSRQCRVCGRIGAEAFDGVVETAVVADFSAASGMRSCAELRAWLQEQLLQQV